MAVDVAVDVAEEEGGEEEEEEERGAERCYFFIHCQRRVILRVEGVQI